MSAGFMAEPRECRKGEGNGQYDTAVVEVDLGFRRSSATLQKLRL